MKIAQSKAVISTLSEKHSEKDLNEVLDLHGLRGQEAKLVISQQLPIIEQRVNNCQIAKNTDQGHVYCIVTGKGLHRTRAVLKPVTERYLLKEGYTYCELDNGAGYKVLFN